LLLFRISLICKNIYVLPKALQEGGTLPIFCFLYRVSMIFHPDFLIFFTAYNAICP